MIIEKIQVEGGFLDGLDVNLANGLNVFIGERGTGKSSVIELIRFCLEARGHTVESTKRANEHAISVLRGGTVTVTLQDGEEKVVVSRNADDERSTGSGPYKKPIIFSQSEIEAVGLRSSGRLRLLDSFVQSNESLQQRESHFVASVRSLTAEATNIRREISDYEDRLSNLPAIENELKELAPKEKELEDVSKEAADKSKRLARLSEKTSDLAVQTDHLARLKEQLEAWAMEVVDARISEPSIESWPTPIEEDPLQNVWSRIEKIGELLAKASDEIDDTLEKTQEKHDAINSNKIKIEAEARSLRKEVDAFQAGAGEIARRGQRLREQKAQLTALRSLILEKNETLSELFGKRRETLDQLDELRQERFDNRLSAAEKINAVLAPRIRISLDQAGQLDQYVSAITEALRGSGIRYNELAPSLASLVSPRELVEHVEGDDTEGLSEKADISRERAGRIVSSLRDSDLADIATVDLEDNVHFLLFDGGDYKDFSKISTGQRCTVILPLILEHRNRILIVDQPEDHIDNAFIVDTLIDAVLRRANEGQIIFTTHNANIPVLGNAALVVQLGSDGHRGFVQVVDELESTPIVDAISKVMEGGPEAFERRANFYKNYEK